jgi:predicted regulator of Ras-like GTPase activity (Roadblock/LC7/MglB family)
MGHEQLLLFDEEHRRIQALCAQLHGEAQARAVLLVDKNGQFIASHGDIQGLDTTSLASLTAGNMAATGALLRLIGEHEFPSVVHEGKHESLHLSVIAQQAILVVMYDARTTLGLVRLRVRKTGEALRQVFDDIRLKAAGDAGRVGLADITDADIDNLFGR